MNFAIATVMFEAAKPWYCMSLFKTLARWNPLNPPDYIKVDHHMPNSFTVVARQALQLGVDGILWVDADMEWLPSDIDEIIKLAELHPNSVIGFAYPPRKTDKIIGAPVALYETDVHGCLKADHVGFVFTWTPIACFKRQEPWFNVEYTDDEGYIGEDDVWFCRNLPRTIDVLLVPKSDVAHSYEPGTRGVS